MLNFVLFLLVLMVVVSLITALVIEAVKKIVSEDCLKRVFKTLEIFSLVFTFHLQFCDGHIVMYVESFWCIFL